MRRKIRLNLNYPVKNHTLKSIEIQACGGVLFRVKDAVVEVLLIYRRNFWDIPKGKLEDGESVAMCAVREVSEEVGIPLPMVVTSLCSTRHTYRQSSVMIKKTTDWFVMVTQSDTFSPQQEEEIDEVRWINLNEAKNMVGFHNLRIVLDRFHKWYSVL
jgi:8-oxo-dGTP pyrophosphatase MutT (NUDIX family)